MYTPVKVIEKRCAGTGAIKRQPQVLLYIKWGTRGSTLHGHVIMMITSDTFSYKTVMSSQEESLFILYLAVKSMQI